MAWNLDAGRPLYAQIVEQIEREILSGKYAPGEKLPSVRDLARDASVNPNTMQKALSELERSGLVHSERTAGRYLTEDISMIQTLKDELAQTQVRAFLKEMKELGLSAEEIIERIRRTEKEGF